MCDGVMTSRTNAQGSLRKHCEKTVSRDLCKGHQPCEVKKNARNRAQDVERESTCGAECVSTTRNRFCVASSVFKQGRAATLEGGRYNIKKEQPKTHRTALDARPQEVNDQEIIREAWRSKHGSGGACNSVHPLPLDFPVRSNLRGKHLRGVSGRVDPQEVVRASWSTVQLSIGRLGNGRPTCRHHRQGRSR